MNTKILLLLVGGMSLSFALMLGIMMSTVGDRRSEKKTHASSPRVVLSERVPSTPSTTLPTEKRSTQPAKNRTDHAPSPSTPSRSTEQASALAAERIEPAQPTPSRPPAAQPLKPDPATLREFSTLKGELRREIGALKKDRDAMIQSLAEVLSNRPTATMIQEIQALDDETAAQTLRYFKSEKRQAALAGLDTQRADRIRRRIRQLGAR